MARKIPSGNLAYKLRRGQPNLLRPSRDADEDPEDTLQSTHRADYQKHKLPSPPVRGKRQELLERYLFEKISKDLAREVFAARCPPKYLSTAHDHFDVPGFEPEARMRPSFRHSLYSDPPITYWSGNRRRVHGVTVPDNPSGHFNSSCRFSKSPAERFDGGEDW